MRRRRLLGVVAAATALVLSPALAGAAPLTANDYGKPVAHFRFCAEAQLDVAGIDVPAMELAEISIGGVIYEDYDDFVESKSSVQVSPTNVIEVRQRVEYVDGMPTMYRCKLRTGESIDEGAWPLGAENNGGRMDVDPHYGFGAAADGVADETPQACSTVNERTIDNVWDSLTQPQQESAEYVPGVNLANGPDQVAFTGPGWLTAPAPYVLEGGVLTVQSRSLVVPTGTAEPRFEGAHYCTFIDPEYLRALILGDVEA
jgi:hypothetical protein